MAISPVFTRDKRDGLCTAVVGEAPGVAATISVGSSADLQGKTLIATILADYLHELTGQDVLRVSVQLSATAAEGFAVVPRAMVWPSLYFFAEPYDVSDKPFDYRRRKRRCGALSYAKSSLGGVESPHHFAPTP